MTTSQKALFTNNTAMLLYGLSAVLIGPTLPGMISSFDLTLTQAGLISAVQNVGGLAGALACLFIAHRVSHTGFAVASFVLLAVTLIAVGLSPGYVVLLLAFAGTGFFIRVLDVMLNAGTGEIAGNNSGRALSTLHMFFSIGAFAGPLAARAIMGAGLSWWQVYLYSGVGYLLVVGTAFGWLRRYVKAGTRQDVHRRGGNRETERAIPVRAQAESPAGRFDPADITADPHIESPPPGLRAAAVAAIGGLMLFYAIHQVALTSWIPYFFEAERGAGADLASLGLSAYWVGIIAGRFVSSRTVDRLGAVVFLAVGCLLSALASLAAVLTTNVVLAEGLFVLAGFTSGATIPLAYAVGYEFTGGKTGRVTAILAVLMLTGRFLGPWLVGLVADRAHLTAAMTIPGFSLLVSAGLAALVGLLQKRRAGFP